jgi:hypothetical protein
MVRDAHQLRLDWRYRQHRDFLDSRQKSSQSLRSVSPHSHSAPVDLGHFFDTAAGGRCEGVQPSAIGGIAGFGAAMLGAMWAYDGWNNVAPLCGEVEDPQRNLPRIFVGSTLLVIALYVGINAAYFYVMSPARIADVSATSSVATEGRAVVRRTDRRHANGGGTNDVVAGLPCMRRCWPIRGTVRHGEGRHRSSRRCRVWPRAHEYR